MCSERPEALTTARRSQAVAAAALLLASACRREVFPPRPPLRPAPAAAARAKVLVDAEAVAHSGELVPAGAAFEWRLPEAASGRLRFAWSAPDRRGEAELLVEESSGDGARASARIAGRRTRSFAAVSGPAVLWNEEVKVDVRGPSPRLRLRLEPAGPLFLTDVRLVRRGSRPDAVVLLLFDTTRRDAVGFGGCKDPSSPNLDAIFRDSWKAERAYAAASWTIPSVASLLTGRVPAVHEDADGSPLGIVPGIPTLAEDFRRAGWSTAAFVANPTLRAKNGFDAGFDTFFVTPYEPASITLPGRETMKHVPSWLEAHRGEPFLLLINLLDPHDPYQPFDRPRGGTPFDPGYRGPIVGDEVNRLQLGEPPPPSPADVRHLEALYHDEVRLADEEVGRLWRGTPENERSRWTVVFTADHGEEFGEHEGWKHGPALFDEVLRVPFAIRPAAGRKSPAVPREALVSLLDVLPTLEALAGLPQPRRPLEGKNLFDSAAWRQRDALPAVTMLTGGAPRAAVVHPGEKLVFFDRLGTRGIPNAEKDPPGHRLALRLREILPSLGRFDLARDPGETRLLPIDHDRFAEDWRAIEQSIAHTRRGLELRLVGPGSPAGLGVTVEGLGPSASVEPFGLEADDRFSWSRSGTGRKLDARLDLGDDVDGFRFDDDSAGDLRVTVSRGSRCAELVLAGARPVPLAPGQTQDVPRAAIPDTIPLFQTPGGCSGVFLWRATGSPPARTAEEQEETWKKLRALGYLH